MERVGRYQVQEELGRGGMGVVLRAVDPLSGLPVAVKLLLTGAADPRFVLEARATARVRHPGVVRLLDVGQDELGRSFLVMELVEGESLQRRLERSGPLPLEEALALGEALCQAVAAAHRAGVIHRDLKPHNILLDRDGRPKLTDFGLTRLEDQSQALTRTGTILGTPAFMAPEQARGEPAAMGPSCDIYGLGATLHATLTGAPPFPANGAMAQLRALLQDAPTPPSRLRPGIPRALDELVLRCLAKRPEDRPASAEALEAELRACRAGLRRPRRLAHSWLLVALPGLLLVLALARSTPSRPPGAPGPTPAPTTDPRAALDELRGRILAMGERGAWSDALLLADEAVAMGPEQAWTWRLRAAVCLHLGGWERGERDLSQALTLAPDEVDDLVSRGSVRRRLGRPDQALADLQRALELRPDHPQALALRGAMRADAGAQADALADLERALSLAPDDLDVLTAHSGVAASAADWEAARRSLDRLLARRPADPDLRRRRGQVRIRLGDPSGALVDFEEALRLGAPSALYWRGAALGLLGRLQEAEADFTRFLQGSPRHLRAWIDRGIARQRLEDTTGALEDFQQAASIDPKNPDPPAARGVLLLNLGRWEEALAELDRARTLGAGSGDVLSARGRALLHVGRPQEALAELARAAEVRPDQANAWRFLAEAHQALDDRRAALEAMDRALGCANASPGDHVTRGAMRLALDDPAGARADAERALELSPDLASARTLLGLILRRDGDPLGALEQLNRALALDPSDSDALLQRAAARAEAGDLPGAIEDLDRLVEQTPDSALAWRNRALAKCRAGQLEAARPDYDRAVELDPSDAPTILDRGRLFLELGQLPAARADLLRARELDPALAEDPQFRRLLEVAGQP